VEELEPIIRLQGRLDYAHADMSPWYVNRPPFLDITALALLAWAELLRVSSGRNEGRDKPYQKALRLFPGF
jgi:hypothetical protein